MFDIPKAPKTSDPYGSNNGPINTDPYGSNDPVQSRVSFSNTTSSYTNAAKTNRDYQASRRLATIIILFAFIPAIMSILGTLAEMYTEVRSSFEEPAPDSEGYSVLYQIDYNFEEKYNQILVLSNDQIQVRSRDIRSYKSSDFGTRTVSFQDEKMLDTLKKIGEDMKASGLTLANDLQMTKEEKCLLAAVLEDNKYIMTLWEDISYTMDMYNCKKGDVSYKSAIANYLLKEESSNAAVSITENLNRYIREMNQANAPYCAYDYSSARMPEMSEVSQRISTQDTLFDDQGISFILKQTSTASGTEISRFKSYVFQYDGTLAIAVPFDNRSSYLKELYAEFEASELYQRNQNNINKNWKSLIQKSTMIPGYWYYEDDNICVIIHPEDFGLSSSELNDVVIKAPFSFD